MKTIRKLAAPVLPFAGEFSPEQLPQAWQNLEEWEIACYPWSAPDGYRPKACARVGVHEGDLHVLMYALEPAIQARETRVGGAVCVDSCLEFFVQPLESDERYLNFEANPLGTMHLGIGAGRAGRAVYGEGRNLTLAAAVVNALRAAGQTVACAESLTGGMLASKLVDVPGASSVLGEAYVTYSNEAKMRLLGVSKDTLRQFGAVSAQCAREMAEGARLAAGADFALSTTGIAGPDGGTPEKPVGLVYVGVASTSGCEVQELHLRGERDWIRELTCVNALNALRLALG